MASVRKEEVVLPQRVPILMYHSIAGPSEPAGRYSVPVDRFRKQIAFLRRWGFSPYTLDDLAEGRSGGEKPVVITFDDGYRDNVQYGFPVLAEYAYPATVYVVSEAVGTSNGWTRDEGLQGRALAGWEELKSAQRMGIAIGSHSATHKRMPTLGPHESAREVESSRKTIEDCLGTPVHHFSYPFGGVDPAIRAQVIEAGYLTASSTESGFNGGAVDLYQLRRIEVTGADSLVSFAIKIALGTNDGSIARLASYYIRRLTG